MKDSEMLNNKFNIHISLEIYKSKFTLYKSEGKS